MISRSIKTLLISSILGLFVPVAHAAIRYISPTGTDSGTCTSGAKCQTFSYASSISSAGDDFEYSEGTHTVAGAGITGFSGVDASNPSRVYCATPLKCTIKNAAPVNIIDATYHDQSIEGFFLWNNTGEASLTIESPDGTALNSQTYNILVSTTFGYSSVTSGFNTSAWSIARISSSSFFNVGSIGGRYGMLVYGCWRMNFYRALASWENWTPSGGQNPAGGLAVYDTHQSTFTHFFVYDTQKDNDPDILDTLGIYIPSNDNGNTAPFTTTEKIRFYAGGVINNKLGHCFGNEGGSGGNNVDVRLVNFAILGCNGVGITNARKTTNSRYEYVTVSSTNWLSDSMAIYGGGSGDSVSGSVMTQSNLAHGPQDGLNGSWTNTNTNVYGFSGSAYSGGASAGSGDTAINPNFVHAIISTSTAVSPKGADLRFEYDRQGAVTATKLWHWPYECTVKDYYKRTIGLSYGIFGTTYTYTQYMWRWRYGNNPPSDYNSTCTNGVAFSDSEYGSDVTAPTAPTNVSTSAVAASSFTFTWTQGTDAVGVTDVKLDVDDNSDFSSPLTGYSNRSLGVVTSTTVTGLTQATTYYFVLRNSDIQGNTSVNSATQSAVTSTLDVTSPTAPGTPMATSTGTSSFNWTWTAATDAVGVTGYRFTLDDDSGFGSPVSGYNDLDVGNVLTKDTINLTPGTIYYARVRAYDAQGNLGNYSTSGTGTTSFTPAPPRGNTLGTGRYRTFPKNGWIRIPK